MELDKNQYVIYKGLPLVREADTIYYGDLNDKYLLVLNVITKKPNGEPDMIMVQICHTENRNKIVSGKQAFKNGLYEALDLGIAWLEHLNKDGE